MSKFPQYWKTRDGRKAVVLCDDAPGSLPKMGYVVHQNGCAPWGWLKDGQCFVERIGDYDLISPWREPVRGEAWAIVLPDGSVDIRTDQDQIDRMLKCIWPKGTAKVRIRYDEIEE